MKFNMKTLKNIIRKNLNLISEQKSDFYVDRQNNAIQQAFGSRTKDDAEKSAEIINTAEKNWAKQGLYSQMNSWWNNTKNAENLMYSPVSNSNKRKTPAVNTKSYNKDTEYIQTLISKTKYGNILPTSKSKTGIDGYWGHRTSQALMSLLNDYQTKIQGGNLNNINVQSELEF
jgi:hypothetical protein